MPRRSTPAQRLRLLDRLPSRRHFRPARQATAAPVRRARTRRTPVVVGVVVVTLSTPLRPLLPLRHRRQGSRLLADLRQPMVGTHRHVLRSTFGRLPAPAGPDVRARLLPSSEIHTWAAAGPVLAPDISQLVTMDWFRLGPAIIGNLLQHPIAYSTTHYPGPQDWVADSGTLHHSTLSAGNISHPVL
jgi:hypothetical protein